MGESESVAVVALHATVWVYPPSERGELAGLDPEATLAGESTDESFPGEEQAFHVANRSDVILQTASECYDMTGIDYIVARDIDLNDRAIGIEPQVSLSSTADEEEALTTEKSFESLPF